MLPLSPGRNPVSLLDLPTELRIEIYQYLFACKYVLHNPWFSLLQVNRQIHAELEDLLKDAALRIRIQPSIVRQVLARNLELHDLGYINTELDPTDRVEIFQTYCMRFGSVIFDITATLKPTYCRLQPSYEKKGNELADALTSELVAETSQYGKGPKVEIIWGSFSRIVYKGITTWDCCVLKGLGSMMALRQGRDGQLTDVLYCAIVLEERHRRGLLEPLPVEFSPTKSGGFGHNLAEKVRLAMQKKA